MEAVHHAGFRKQQKRNRALALKVLNRQTMKTTLGLFALALGVAAPIHAISVTPTSSSVVLTGQADAGAGTIFQTGSDSVGSLLGNLSASTLASAINGNASVDAGGSASASFAGAGQGSVSFGNIGWSSRNVQSGSAAVTAGTDWSYVFAVDAPTTVSIDYAIASDAATTNPFGLNGFQVLLLNSPSGGFVSSAFLDIETSGTHILSLPAAGEYIFRIQNNANISGGLGTRTALMDATFNWEIVGADRPVATPEISSTLALLLLSVTGLGALRQKLNR